MTHLSDTERLIWLASTLSNVVLLAVVCLKHRIRELPIFAAFVAAAIVRTGVLYCTRRYGSPLAYFYAYWGSTILVDVCLQLGVVYEVATASFRQTGKWAADVYKHLFRIMLGAVVLATLLTLLMTSESSRLFESVVVKGSFFSAVLMAELFASMLIVSVAVGIPWKRHAAKIALGFGAYATLVVLIEAAHDLFGKSYSRFNQADMFLFNVRAASYVCCQSYWMFWLWKDTPASSQGEAASMALLWAGVFRKRNPEREE